MKLAIFLMMSFATFLAGTGRADEALSLEQLMARYSAAQERLNRCTVTTHERWMIMRADGSPEQILSTRQCDVRLDGSRANLLVNEVSYPKGATVDSNSQGNANEFNYVCNDQVLEVFYPHEKFDVRPDHPSGVMGRLAPQAEDDFFVRNAMGNGAIAFGLTTFLGPVPVTKLISMSKTVPQRDELGYRLAGTAPDGTRYTVWFDPESSFVVRKLRFEQSGATLNDNRFQYNRRVLSARYGFADKAAIDSVVFELHNVQVTPWKDSHLITGVESTKTMTAADGSQAVERTFHTLTDWNLAPDFSDKSSFQPRLPIPEGARVKIRDNPSLEYSYKNGQIQLEIHEKTVESLAQVRLPSRPTAPRIQWIWAVVAGVLGIVWWSLRNRNG